MAAAVGGAFWIAFAVGVTVAAITGTAYAELVTKYPQAAGASLYVNKAFGNKALTFLVTVSFLVGQLRGRRLAGDRLRVLLRRALGRPAGPAGHRCVFVLLLSIVNFIGITESVVINMLMTFVEIFGLIIVLVIGIWYVAEGNADFGVLTDVRAPTAARPWPSSPVSRSPSSR